MASKPTFVKPGIGKCRVRDVQLLVELAEGFQHVDIGFRKMPPRYGVLLAAVPECGQRRLLTQRVNQFTCR